MILQPGNIPGTPDRIRKVCLIVEHMYIGKFPPPGKKKYRPQYSATLYLRASSNQGTCPW
jgi:hypothetical protein